MSTLTEVEWLDYDRVTDDMAWPEVMANIDIRTCDFCSETACAWSLAKKLKDELKAKVTIHLTHHALELFWNSARFCRNTLDSSRRYVKMQPWRASRSPAANWQSWSWA